MAKVYDYAVEAERQRRGAWPVLRCDEEIPDEWLALLNHLHGQPMQLVDDRQRRDRL